MHELGDFMHSQISKIKVGIIGARGYSGLELARLLLDHPLVELKFALATQNDWSLESFLPEKSARKIKTGNLSELPTLLKESGVEVYFLATPAEASIELAHTIYKAGKTVIDLSGAFRLPLSTFEKTYGMKHAASELLDEAVFGLSPFEKSHEGKQGNATLISNPGCYATSVMMALIPLLKAGVVDAQSLVIDSKSGTSGAGRKASEDLLFTEVDGECLPYRVGKHQHLPEITQAIEKFSGAKTDPFFTTHLLATRRGIISSIYGRVKPGTTVETIAKIYDEAYSSYDLVEHGEATKKHLVSLKRVVGSARTQIAYTIQGEKLFLFSLIDNLMKGAASQAVENLNVYLGRNPSFSLEQREGNL